MMHSHRSNIIVLLLIVAFLIGGIGLAYAQYPGFEAPSARVAGSSGGGLVPVSPSVDGGAIPVGATSQVVVLFRNEGSQIVETGLINLYPSSNISAEISLNQCAAQLSSGAECAIALSIKGLQAGSWRLEMLMRHSGRTRLVTTTLTGDVSLGADSSSRMSSDLEMVPNELDFGSLSSSQTMVDSVVLRNVTSNPINISDISINSADSSGFSVHSDCSELKAGQACIANVTWAPKQKGPSTGVLVVYHDGPTALSSVVVKGEYDPDDVEEVDIFPEAVPGRGLLVSSQVEFDFGSDVSSASTMTVSLVNTGDSDLTLSNIKISGSDNGLSLGSTGCSEGLVLHSIEACPLTLTWSPTRVGNVLDDIQVIHDGARGILVLPVRGAAASVVSQDQKAIVLSKTPTKVIGSNDVAVEEKTESKEDTKQAKDDSTPKTQQPAKDQQTTTVMNASSALDGLKITSFSANRAIVNGPGGSRLVFDGEPIMLGGVMWDVYIQKNGIEFAYGQDRVLLLFDRSLSSVNRVSGQTSSGTASSGTASSSTASVQSSSGG